MNITRTLQLSLSSSPNAWISIGHFNNALLASNNLRTRALFLQRCLEEQVICKSFLPTRLKNSDGKPFGDYEISNLKRHITDAKEKRRILCQNSRKFKNDVFKYVHPYEVTQVLDFCYNNMRIINSRLRRRLEEKLNRLISESTWEKEKKEKCILNLSSKQLNNTTALSYGMSFSASYEKPNFVNILESIEEKKIPDQDKNIVKGIVYHCLSEPYNPPVPLRFKKAIAEIKKDRSLHITKADKSKTIVILDKLDYVNKMNELLNDETVYKKLDKNPLKEINKKFNKKLKEILNFDDQLIKKLFVFTPNLAYMYGLIKTHKPNNPARPVISSVKTASYKLSKWLVNLLSPLLGNISKSHIKNNRHFVEILTSLNLNYNFKMFSLDVTSLYTKVPVNDLLNFLLVELEKYDLILKPSEIIELIELCIKDNVFIFENVLYLQISGLSMGNPLSSLLANLYMEFFERDILTNIILQHAYVWFRYVDDCFICWPEEQDINEFLNDLNNLVPTIKFTLETENNCTLPFLDVLVHRCDRSFKFEIYRKPTNINSFIHNFSNQENKIKKSVFITMFLRALNIVSPEFLDNEINNIYKIGYDHKYNKSFLDACFKQSKKTYYKVEQKPKKEYKNILVLPYYEKFKNIPYLCNKINLNVIFSYKDKISNILIKNSPNDDLGVVYKINCQNCDKFYIGNTGRHIDVRMSEHKALVKSKDKKSPLHLHYLDTGHSMDLNHVEIITKCPTYKKRNLIESFFINATWNNNINIHSGPVKFDNIAKHFFKKIFPREILNA